MTRPFHIMLSPIRSDMVLSVSRKGETLIVNGQRIACAALMEGDRIALDTVGCEMLVSDIVATQGAIRLTLLFPHGPGAPEGLLFPDPLTLTKDGPAALPVA